MLVTFLKSWKDFDEGEEKEIMDSIAEGLILGGVCTNSGFQSKRDAETTVTGRTYKKSLLLKTQTEIATLTRRLEVLKKKEDSILKDIEKLESHVEKSIEAPAVDKMLRRGTVTK